MAVDKNQPLMVFEDGLKVVMYLFENTRTKYPDGPVLILMCMGEAKKHTVESTLKMLEKHNHSIAEQLLSPEMRKLIEAEDILDITCHTDDGRASINITLG